MVSVWRLAGEQGYNWNQAQVAVNSQTASYQFVIESVRGKGKYGNIAIDDISLMDSCPPRDDSSRIIVIATTLAGGVFLSIEPVYETVPNVDWMFYEDVATNPNESEDISPKGRESLHDWVGEPSNADKTSGYETPVENEHQGPGNETVGKVNRGFYDDVATSANTSEDISTQGRTSDHEEVEVPSNAHKTFGRTELNKRPDTVKTGATGDGDYQAFLKEDGVYVIPAPEESQHKTPGQNETYEEPKLSPENPVYTELDVNRVHGRNTTGDGTYQKLVKRDSDYVIPAHERKESHEDIKMGSKLPTGYEELDQSKLEAEI
ncbi:MAM domain-containing glycosylphosphatidylinositol anchor 2-like [Paramuricea clavata]|uniref:MAM domain-containing glycosylphosphatidylinositol anchor 2-like n=1 Tax=Paramuricea clavata TaxID=317549 RepID=A0A6S7HYM1_PARCT|nr:MAM domain-containing glycosylphosphatidylinositol anchor 2-like [Paramuricea clavata]